MKLKETESNIKRDKIFFIFMNVWVYDVLNSIYVVFVIKINNAVKLKKLPNLSLIFYISYVTVQNRLYVYPQKW